MKNVGIFERAGAFAENKDVARDIRTKDINPTVSQQKEIALDFTGVEGVTQSFIHALISEVIRMYGPEVLDIISFKGCSDEVKSIISIVVEYTQETE